MRTNYLLLITFVLILSSCKKFLTKLPLDQLTDETYWTSEDNVVRLLGFYDRKFIWMK